MKWLPAKYARKGNPSDNTVMESFYRTLKQELVQDADYNDPEQARMKIFKYIVYMAS
jgi:putative transposase